MKHGETEISQRLKGFATLLSILAVVFIIITFFKFMELLDYDQGYLVAPGLILSVILLLISFILHGVVQIMEDIRLQNRVLLAERGIQFEEVEEEHEEEFERVARIESEQPYMKNMSPQYDQTEWICECGFKNVGGTVCAACKEPKTN